MTANDCDRWLKLHADWQRAESEAAALRTEVGRQSKMLDVCNVVHQHNVKLKSEHNALRAEVERLRNEVAIAWDDSEETNRANRAESSLAEARALLEDVVAVHGDEINLDGVSRWLAANPESPRAAAERAVLDACAKLSDVSGDGYGPTIGETHDVYATELARRAVKP